MKSPPGPKSESCENLRRCERTQVNKYWIESSSETKHGYLIIVSLRSFWSDQRRRTWTKHAQDDKKREPTPNTQKQGCQEKAEKELQKVHWWSSDTRAGTAASRHNMKKIYQTTRTMPRRFKATNQQIRDPNGCLLTPEKFQQFQHNGPSPINTPILPPSNHNIVTGKTLNMWINY